jgi:CRISPR system Cascade subunit CasB
MTTPFLDAEKRKSANQNTPDFLKLLTAYEKSDNGTRAVIRRAASIEQLLDEPAFYRLVGSVGYESKYREQWARVVFCLCLPNVRHVANGPSLGAALSRDGRIKDRRLFQVLRSEPPHDMTQLRRLILFVDPVLDWVSAAKALWFWDWGKRSRRELLEDFILYQPASDSLKSAAH